MQPSNSRASDLLFVLILMPWAWAAYRWIIPKNAKKWNRREREDRLRK